MFLRKVEGGRGKAESKRAESEISPLSLRERGQG
jgi:hypothetical protein